MAVKVLTRDEIEQIPLSRLLSQQQIVITNVGLSDNLKKELSLDISGDGIVELIRIEVDGTWHQYSGNPTTLVGTNENGTPIYKHVWNDEDWGYLPFQYVADSAKASGELVGSSLTIQNYDPALAELFDRHEEAIPIQMFAVSKLDNELLWYNTGRYITTLTNLGLTLTAEITSGDIFAEPVPCQTYSSIIYRR